MADLRCLPFCEMDVFLTKWNFACPDWEKRLRLGQSLVPKLPLNIKEAERAVRLFNRLCLPDVAGNPPLKEAAGEWQRDVVRPIFGSLTDDGVRHVPEVFAMVPKKNNKTTGGAAIMITALLMNKRPRAEFGLVSATKEIANLAFEQASGMIAIDPEDYLQSRFHVRDNIKTIVDRKNGSKLKIKTFDLLVATGGKWAGLLLDELHLLSQISFASRLVGQLRGGMIANPEAFLIEITTQSDEPPSGIFKSELDYARGVRDGRIVDEIIEGVLSPVRMLPLIYEFSEKMQADESRPYLNTKFWHRVLPNLGKSIHLPRLIADYKTSRDKGDEEEKRWLSQHLNIQMGMGTHDGRWAGADYWNGAADESLQDLDTLLSRCDVVVVGGDGGGLDDLLGLGVIGRERVTNDWLSWSHAWCQEDVLRKRKDIAEKLIDFEKEGSLTICRATDQMEEGETVATKDIREFCDVIERIFRRGLLPEKLAVGLDPYAIGAITDELKLRGLETEANGGCVTGIRQGSALSPATWGMERKLKDGTFWHSGTQLMVFCVGNAKAEQRGNATLITKQTAGKAKIDPFVALQNAFMLMSKNPTAAKPPVDLDDWLNTQAMAVG